MLESDGWQGVVSLSVTGCHVFLSNTRPQYQTFLSPTATDSIFHQARFRTFLRFYFDIEIANVGGWREISLRINFVFSEARIL